MANTKITSNVISDDITLGGNPTTTTQSAGNNTTRIATTAFVKTAIDATIDSAPGALDTLNELAAAIGDDANFSTTVTNSIATKLPLAGGTMTGNIVMGDDTSIGIADNAERIEFDGAGDISFLGANVGIGETTPAALLHLKGVTATNEASHILFENTQGAKKFAVGAGTSGVTNNNFVVRNVTDSTFPLVITDAGKVGIGTTSPDVKLHVFGGDSGATSFDAGDLITIENSDSVALNLITPSSNQGLILFSDNGTRGIGLIGYNHSENSLRFHTNNAERMRISSGSDGIVGIGVSDPKSHIHTHIASSGGAYHQFTNASTNANSDDGWKIGIHDDENFIIWGQESAESFRVYNNGAYRFTIDHNGSVGIPAAAKFYLDGISDTYMSEYSANEFEIQTGGARRFALSGGNAYFSGSVNANHNFSDERLKENIVVIPNALEKVTSLRGITFTRKSDKSVGTGLIAQELEKVLPEAVFASKTIDSLEDPDAEEYKGIRYETTVGLLVEAIKELEERIKTLEDA
tara:strand:- start:200 stop:1762 length:1563 start_codon:yes stop_codon:yes gene_type:complete